MRRSVRLGPVVCLALLLLAPGAASAGPYGDAFTKCLVRSTSDADRSYLVKWMFAALSLHPEVKSFVAITPEKREALNAGAADLFRRLIMESCRSEASEALRYEGEMTFQQGFAVLGNVAGRGLMAHPNVAAFTKKLGTHLDGEAIKKELRADSEGSAGAPSEGSAGD